MSRPRNSYRFLSLCLSQHPNSRALAELCAAHRDGEPDYWEALIQTASEENILPALYGRIQKLKLAADLPRDVSEFFSTVQKLNLDRNRLALAEAASITKILNSVEIEPVVLKGIAYLLTGTYGDVASRYLIDIDLLVPQSQLPVAVEALRFRGYAPADPDAPPIWHHHHPLLLSPKNVGVELHYCLGLGMCKSLLSGEEMIRRSSLQEREGARFRVPSPEDLITHHIMHSQIQDRYFQSVWPALRNMYDLALLAEHFKPTLDWSVVENRFRRHRRYGVLAMYLLLVASVLEMDRPFPIRLDGMNRVRWFHRRVLRTFPALRRIDPFYILSSTITHRAHLIRDFQRAAGGWGHLLSILFRMRFYRSVVRYGVRRAACDALDWPSSAKL